VDKEKSGVALGTRVSPTDKQKGNVQTGKYTEWQIGSEEDRQLGRETEIQTGREQYASRQ
jgi:hypothetical protein